MDIIEAVSQVYNVSPETIRRKTHARKSVEPRMICIALLRATGQLKSYRDGNYFDVKKDAVRNSIIKTSNLIKYNSSFRGNVVEVLKLIYPAQKTREVIVKKMIVN